MKRGISPERPARADQRGLRDGQDRGHQVVPELPHSSTGATSSRRCRRISTARTTISISTARTCCPALIRKFHDAKTRAATRSSIWGSGTPRREFLHVDDLADACLFLMQHYDAAEHINVGTGDDLSIRELAEIVRDIVHPSANLVFDREKPDGTPRKLLDCRPPARARMAAHHRTAGGHCVHLRLVRRP